MSNDIELLVNAITALKPVSNWVKDYLNPIMFSFLSAVFGATLATWGVRYSGKKKELYEIEKKKIDAANFWILQASECFDNLITIKRNYSDRDLRKSIDTINIPSILLDFPRVNVDMTNLIFLAREEKLVKKSKIERKTNGFGEIHIIRSMMTNYNIVLDRWEKRNQIVQPLVENIVRNNSSTGGPTQVSIEQIEKSVDAVNLRQSIHLSETVVEETDELLTEFHKFLTEFPKIAEIKICKKVQKKYGPVLKVIQKKEAEELVSKKSIT